MLSFHISISLLIGPQYLSTSIAYGQLTEQQQLENEIEQLSQKIDEVEADNMNTLVASIITVIGTIIVAGVTAIIALKRERIGRIQEQKDKLELEYDISLRKDRIKAYNKLWGYTETNLNKSSIAAEFDDPIKNLRNWYYEEGNGVYLTEFSQKLYHNLKNRLKELEEKWDKLNDQEKEEGTISIGQIASGLRTSLSKDIGGREDPKILSTYDDLRIISPLHTKITGKKQEFVVKYFGTKKISIPDGKAYLRITDVDSGEHIALVAVKQESIDPNGEIKFEWNYEDKIFGVKSVSMIYILTKVTIGEMSVVQTFQLHK